MLTGNEDWSPELRTEDFADPELLHDAQGWENDHGAQEVRVYRVRPT